MLEARVAKLEADLGHIQRDLTSVQSDLKTLLATVSEIRANTATLIERTAHLATREWVGMRIFTAGTVVVLLLGSAIGFAPRLQAFLGNAAPPASGGQAASPTSR